MTTDDQTHEAAPEAASATPGRIDARQFTSAEQVREITLSNGIVLSLRPVPNKLIADAAASVPQPVVPRVLIEAKNVEEENPNHPDYIKALQDLPQRRSDAAFNMALSMGTNVVYVPEGLFGPDDDWQGPIVESFEAIGAEPPDFAATGRRRYLDWLRNYAIPTEEELVIIGRVCITSIAVTEGEVQSAVDSFRRGASRATNLSIQISAGDLDGDSLPPALSGAGP